MQRATASRPAPAVQRATAWAPVIQRVIVRVDHVGKRNPSEKAPKYDFEVQLLQREIDEMVAALQVMYPGEEVINLYKPTQLNKPDSDEPIRLASHGGTGKLNSEPPERIADLLITAGLFSKDRVRHINIHSCNVGAKINGRNFAQKLGDRLLEKTQATKPFTVRAPGAAYSLTLESAKPVEMLYGSDEPMVPDDKGIFQRLGDTLIMVIKGFDLNDLYAFTLDCIKADKGGYVGFREKWVNEIMGSESQDSEKLAKLLDHLMKEIGEYSISEAFNVVLPVLMGGTYLKKKSPEREKLKTEIRVISAAAFKIKKGAREQEEEENVIGIFRFEPTSISKSWIDKIDWK